MAEENNAMFGLKWKMSQQQIKAIGISIERISSDKNLSTYKTYKLPKPISFGESYYLIFDESELVKLGMYSETIENDPYGTKGKELFERIIALMNKTYKLDKTYCTTGNELYEESDEFYECLRYKGCGMWVATFSDTNKHIIVELRGLRRGTGFLVITAESNYFDNSSEKYENLKNEDDSKAFE